MSATVKQLRENAYSIFQAGIDAADPYLAIKRCLIVTDNNIDIALDTNNSCKKRRHNWTKIHIIAFGKAACRMTQAALDIIPSHYIANKAIAVTNYNNVIPLDNVEVFGAGHPIPDSSGLSAAKHISQKLKSSSKGELVLALISGGGSALLPYPVSGISLEEKQKTTHLLLTSSANIQQINCVRKHLSKIKGGQLAKLAMPSDLHSFILSDVIGDDLSSIASGTTVADDSSFKDAINIITKQAIWDKIPLSVQSVLSKGAKGEIKETPEQGDECFKNASYTLIASNAISLKQSGIVAKKLGYSAEILSTALCCEAREAAQKFALYAKELETKLKQPTVVLAGGETTVNVTGSGIGGRNQEMALAFAIAADKLNLKAKWVFLSGGTDGQDGPTDAAGGLVDSKTLDRLKQKDIDPESLLNNNDSYSALKESQDLVITGATGTNVADLQILLIQPE